MKEAIKYLNVVFFVILQHFLFAQQGKLNFNFSYSEQRGKMTELNAYLNDSNYDKAFLFNEESYLQDINKFNGHISYQFWKNVNLGLFGCYQTSGSTVNHKFPVYDPVENTTVEYSYNYELKAINLAFGISTEVLYSDMFNFRDKGSFLKRLIVSNIFNWGVAQSNLRSSQVGITPQKYEFNEYNYKAMHLIGDVSVNVNYEFLRKPILSSLGLRFGYQFNKSGILRNIVGQTLRTSDDTSVNLDFSGIYFGVNFSIGK